ncbi:DUF669 domain-containing protein [Chelativorans sp.]|uniref:DUF669 domain-containing protein n=1 Tax=Chelativorans sp. TaxID=2203393 RepID=UPI0028123F04|nr:DUF669 domain-containing protein [Chelativorans sp.]
MANIAGSYDPNAEPGGDFEPIPAGEYRAKIIESDVEDISKRENKGRCLRLTWQVETGPYDGRLIWQRLNMWGENMNNIDKVISIAQSQFAAIRQATGKLTPQDSSELHGIACTIRVKVRQDPGYSPSNEVTSVKPVGGAPAGQGTAPQQRFTPPPPQTGANGSGGSAPWRKPAA